MSGEPRPFTPLARLLFGWTRAPGARLGALAALGAVGATVVFAEFLHPRLGLRLPMEAQPGFYALVGAGVIGAAMVAAWAVSWLLQKEQPYKQDGEESGEANNDSRA